MRNEKRVTRGGDSHLVPRTSDLEEIEVQLLLDGIYHRYGYDFRDYAQASLRRRLRECMRAEKIGTVSAFQERVLRDPECMERFVLTLSINVTAMFRDPSLYVALRQKVVPVLRTYPYVRVWHAGCSSGEEVYSTAILLHEEGLYERCKIYATDINGAVLDRARAGIFPLAAMQDYTTNYVQAGGQRPFSEYYTAKYENAIFSPLLKRNMVFAEHNLVTDGSFNEFNLVLCRNVMIYFNKDLQDRVHRLLYESLGMFGYLCLGAKESVKFTPLEERYEVVEPRDKVYRKVR